MVSTHYGSIGSTGCTNFAQFLSAELRIPNIFHHRELDRILSNQLLARSSSWSRQNSLRTVIADNLILCALKPLVGAVPAVALCFQIPWGLDRVRPIDHDTIQLIPFRHPGCITHGNSLSVLGQPGDFPLVLRDRECTFS